MKPRHSREESGLEGQLPQGASWGGASIWYDMCMMWRNQLCYKQKQHFAGGGVDKSSPAKAGGKGSIPGPRRFHMLLSN